MNFFTFLKLTTVFIFKKINIFFLNFNQMHGVYLFFFWLLFFLKQYIFPIGDYNNACYEGVQSVMWYCSLLSDVTLYILIPELIIYGIIASSLFAIVKGASDNNNGTKIKEAWFLYFIIPYILLRVFSVTPSDNSFLSFLYQYYYLIWGYGFWVLICIFISFMVFTKSDFKFRIPQKDKKQVREEVLDEPTDDVKDDLNILMIRSSLPPIIDRILYSSFSKISIDSDGNKMKGLFEIKEILKENDDDYFVVLELSEALEKSILELSKYDWTLGIESYGYIKWIQRAKWRSKAWKTWVVMNIRSEAISFSDSYGYPDLLTESNLLKSPLDLLLWKNDKWEDVVCNLAKCPHLLVAWKTGWWKSVWMNDILVSLMKNIIKGHSINIHIIDPKRVDYVKYKGLENIKIDQTVDQWLNTVKWLVAEMLRRYEILESYKAENIEEYKELGHSMGYIVLFIDELADLMMRSKETKKELEQSIARLWQMARACGIHIVIGTQRPSADIVTGIIKANIPSILGFWVTNTINSRIIFDTNILANIKNIWEAYLKISWKDKVERLKTYYIPKWTELVDFINYYKAETEWEMQTEIMKGVPVHPKNKHHVIHKFEDSIDEWEYHIDKMSSSFLILRELVKEWGYKSRKDFFERLKKYNISKGTVEKLINNLKQKELIEYVESAKINKIAKDIDHKYLNELYSSIYSVIQK